MGLDAQVIDFLDIIILVDKRYMYWYYLNMNNKCYACGKEIKGTPALAVTEDDQVVYVGVGCLREINKAGADGFQHPKSGPRIMPIKYASAKALMMNLYIKLTKEGW